MWDREGIVVVVWKSKCCSCQVQLGAVPQLPALSVSWGTAKP